MEFLDEFESKPRFLFQSKNLPPQGQPSEYDDALHPSSSKLSLGLLISLCFSLVVLALACFYLNVEPLRSLLLWLSLSFLVGPFAPPSLTAGDIRVGLGPPLKETPATISVETNEKFSRKSTKAHKKTPPEDATIRLDGGYLEKSSTVDGSHVDFTENQSSGSNGLAGNKFEEEPSEWSEIDDELLKKLMGKHPAGKPGRWEAIAEGFKGKHKVDVVIAKAKEMGERKGSDQDSYNKFLKDRKPVDKRVLNEEGNESNAGNRVGNENVEEGRRVSGWTAAEDLALLNALKVFPKDVAMRWEKISASVPGKSKSACMKRVAELKKDFRSSKASSGQPQPS